MLKPPSVTIPTVSMPSIKTSEVSIKSLTMSTLSTPKIILPAAVVLAGVSVGMGCLPKITLPQITLPTIVLPNIELPKIEIPKIEIPKIEIPKINLDLPNIALPNIQLPKLTLPNIQLPTLTLPQITLPKIVLPNIELPQINIPHFEIPKIVLPKIVIPQIKLPEFKIPHIDIPSINLPKLTLLQITLPQIVLPDIKIPQIKLPEITLPTIQLPEIKLPELTLPPLPTLPKLPTLPHISIPTISIPKIEIPKIDLMCLSVPAVTIAGGVLGKNTLPNIKSAAALMPTQLFRPQAFKNPKMRTCSTRRARAWVGGTYFRSIKPGQASNNISIRTTRENDECYFVVSNSNKGRLNSIIGEAEIEFIENTLNDTDIVIIEATPPIAKKYSISLKIRNSIQEGTAYTLPAPIAQTPLTTINDTVVIGGLSIKIKSMKSTSLIVQSRTRVYKLTPKVIPASTPQDSESVAERRGWDIPALRALVNAKDDWIEMIERPLLVISSGTGEGSNEPAQIWNINDKQDHAPGDDQILTEFSSTSLSNGDGLPDSPTSENTGGTRAVVFVNYGENKDGSLGEVNTVHEWVGDDAVNGTWKPY